jgi:hypothetical protein
MTVTRRRILATALASLALAAPVAAAATDPPSADTLRRVELVARESERRHGIPVGAVTTTAGVATLELVDPLTLAVRTVSTANGVHVTLCRRSLQRCRLPARAARAQARFIARRAFETTAAKLVVVALPQSPTRHLQLVFERGRMSEPECVYGMAGLLTPGGEDSVVLVRLS